MARAGSGAYAASKFALAGWSESLTWRSARHGVHVGLVLPGFMPPRASRPRASGRARTRWIVSRPERVADAIVDAGPGGRAERYVPRPYALAASRDVLLAPWPTAG